MVLSSPKKLIGIVCFSLGDKEEEKEYYAFEIAYVDRVIKLKKEDISPLPSDIPYLKGIISLKGEIIPVIDISHFLGVLPPKGDKAIVIRLKDIPLCIQVDDIESIEFFYPEAKENPPEVGLKNKEIIEAIFTIEKSKEENKEEKIKISLINPQKLYEKHAEISGIIQKAEIEKI